VDIKPSARDAGLISFSTCDTRGELKLRFAASSISRAGKNEMNEAQNPLRRLFSTEYYS